MCKRSQTVCGLLLAAVLCLPPATARAGMDLYADIKFSAAQTQAFVDQAAAAGFSRIIVSLSGGDGTVLWQTPREEYYVPLRSRLAIGYDALADLIAKSHAAGIQVVGSVIVAEGGSIVEANPQWAARDKNGNDSAGIEFLDPTLSFAYSGARQAKVDVMMDLVNNYDIDGIFLDFTRYLNGFGYEQAVIDYFQTNHGFDPRTVNAPPVGRPDLGSAQWNLFADYKQQNVQSFVELFRSTVHASSNPVMIGTFSDARWGMDLDINHLGRDFPAWAQAGLVDEVWVGNYTETSLSQIRGVMEMVRAAVGPDVRLNGSLTTWNNHFTTLSQFLRATVETVMGKADNLFVYREDFLVNNSLWDEAAAANLKLGRLHAPLAGYSTHVNYNAAALVGDPVTANTGWTREGVAMSDQGEFLLQSHAPLAYSRYRIQTTDVMDYDHGYYAIDFKVRPLGDLTSASNPFNLHVQWADGTNLYNIVIDMDANDGSPGTAGSINYGSSGFLRAVNGIDWSQARRVTVVYHSDDKNFFFYVDGELMSYIAASSLRIGSSTPGLRDILTFGDSSDLPGDVGAEWYYMTVVGLPDVIPEPTLALLPAGVLLLRRSARREGSS